MKHSMVPLKRSKPFHSKRWFAALGVVCSALFFSAASNANEVSGEAPDFTLKSSTGKNLQLSDFRGQVLLINFWATWCGPCRQEMPKLNDIHKRYKRAGVAVWGVNVEDDSNLADTFLSNNPVDFPVLYDVTSKVSELYNVDAMPTTVIVDRDGKMRYLHRGYKPGYEDIYRKQIKALLRE